MVRLQFQIYVVVVYVVVGGKAETARVLVVIVAIPARTSVV